MGGVVQCLSRFSEEEQNEFFCFPDKYRTVKEVTDALVKSGLESSNLIVGVDFTKSNLTQGRKTFGGRSLHHIEDDVINPYQRVISVVGRTLEKFDDDNWIPTFGFGDLSTKDHSVFPFAPDPRSNRFCQGFNEVLETYSKIAPLVKLSGPTNFAPLIYKSMEIVRSSPRTEYHILVIIADGQVQVESDTITAIQKASALPISIITVGVGDGPWDQMVRFDDRIHNRKFDNFQFVHYDAVMKRARKKNLDPDAQFSLNALMEIPLQYGAIKKLGLLGIETRNRSGETATEYNYRSKYLKPMPVNIYGGGGGQQQQQQQQLQQQQQRRRGRGQQNNNNNNMGYPPSQNPYLPSVPDNPPTYGI